MKETSYHKITVGGEFLTNFFRQRFWSELQRYHVVKKIFLKSFSFEDSKEEEIETFFKKILSGELKIIDTEDGYSFEEDDIQYNCSIEEKDREIEKEIKERFYNFIDSKPLLFADIYTCEGGYSFCLSAGKKKTVNFDEDTEFSSREVVLKRLFGDGLSLMEDQSLKEKPLFSGTYLIIDPELAYEIFKEESFYSLTHNDVMRILTIYWNKEIQSWVDEGKNYDTFSSFQLAVLKRNIYAIKTEFTDIELISVPNIPNNFLNL